MSLFTAPSTTDFAAASTVMVGSEPLPQFVFDFIASDSTTEAMLTEIVTEGPEAGGYRFRGIVALADIPAGAMLLMRSAKSHVGRFPRRRMVRHESVEATAAMLAL